MPTHNDNKYTVHQRLADLTSRVTELEADNKRLRVHLAGELKTAISDAKNVIQSSIRVPVDGKDGRDGRDSTVPGPQGSVIYIGPQEVADAVKQVRAELLRQRAAFVGRILQGIADNQGTNGTQRHFCKHLESILRDIENL
jgi:hypothetical protein